MASEEDNVNNLAPSDRIPLSRSKPCGKCGQKTWELLKEQKELERKVKEVKKHNLDLSIKYDDLRTEKEKIEERLEVLEGERIHLLTKLESVTENLQTVIKDTENVKCQEKSLELDLCCLQEELQYRDKDSVIISSSDREQSMDQEAFHQQLKELKNQYQMDIENSKSELLSIFEKKFQSDLPSTSSDISPDQWNRDIEIKSEASIIKYLSMKGSEFEGLKAKSDARIQQLENMLAVERERKLKMILKLQAYNDVETIANLKLPAENSTEGLLRQAIKRKSSAVSDGVQDSDMEVPRAESTRTVQSFNTDIYHQRRPVKKARKKCIIM